MNQLFSQFAIRKLGAAVLLLSALEGMAADVEFCGLLKLQEFQQWNAVAPTLLEFDDADPDVDGPFLFGTLVSLSTSNAVTNATVTVPGGATQSLVLADGGFVRSFSDVRELKPELDNVYSNATYTLFLQTQNEGDKTLNLTLPTADAYPNPPRISNFPAAQSVNPVADFTLTWDAFIGGQPTDYSEVEVYDADTETTYFETPGPGEPGALNGTSVTVLIPGGTLPAGRNLEARLMFLKIVDVDDTSYGGGVTGFAAFGAETVFPVKTTGGTDLILPSLQSFYPHYFQTDVGAKTTVSFSFSETMSRSLPVGASISWSSNVNAGLFTYTWSAADRALFCVYPPGFPTNAVVAWELNPDGSPQNLRDLAGNLLPTQGGSFTTGANTDVGIADLDAVALVKGRFFQQTSTSPADLERYQFALTTDMNVMNSVSNGLLTLPNARSIAPGPDFGESIDFQNMYASQAHMDSFFPNGTHQARYDTVHDGQRTFSLNLSGDTYPNVPTILNFTGTQSVNPSNSYVLSWSSFSGGTVNDYMGVEIETSDGDRSIFETPNFNEAGALDGTATSVNIPAFTFAPNRTYQANVFFAKLVQKDTTTYPGAAAVTAYFTATAFEIQTVGETIHPMLSISLGSNAIPHITVTGERDRLYTIEVSESIASGGAAWNPWFAGSASGKVNGFLGSFEFHDYTAATGGARFYRAFEGNAFGGP